MWITLYSAIWENIYSVVIKLHQLPRVWTNLAYVYYQGKAITLRPSPNNVGLDFWDDFNFNVLEFLKA